MALPQFMTWWKLGKGKKKKKKPKSIRELKTVRHGQTKLKKQIMDEALKYE